jgi:hypothetical protein
MTIFQRNFYTSEVDTHLVNARVVIGATGAVGATTGFLTVVRTDTGDYTMVAADNFNSLVGFNISFVNAPSVATVQITTADPDAALQAKTAIAFTCYDFAGAAVDPDSGAIMVINLLARRSTVGE